MVIQYVSIVIEFLIALMGLLIVFKKKKIYGWGIFLTFAIYVFYDFAKLASWNISQDILYASFFVATVSAFWAVFKIFMEKKK